MSEAEDCQRASTAELQKRQGDASRTYVCAVSVCSLLSLLCRVRPAVRRSRHRAPHLPAAFAKTTQWVPPMTSSN